MRGDGVVRPNLEVWVGGRVPFGSSHRPVVCNLVVFDPHMGGHFAYDGGEAGVLAFCQAAYYVAEEISVNMVFVWCLWLLLEMRLDMD